MTASIWHLLPGLAVLLGLHAALRAGQDCEWDRALEKEWSTPLWMGIAAGAFIGLFQVFALRALA